MKVICLHENIDEYLAKTVNLKEGSPRLYDLTQNKEYTVLGLSYFINSDIYAGYPVVEIKNDAGGLTSAPLFLFNIIDDTPSIHWHIKFDKEEDFLQMWPKSFYQDFYFDDLSEGEPDIVDDFNEVCKLLELET